jgi:hypothetical protein
MTTILVRFLIAIILAAGAWFSWSESRRVTDVADARLALATFDFAAAANAPATKASVAYWRGRYDGVAVDSEASEPDADLLLAIANAAFRESQRATAVGPAAVQRLDGVLQAYASALKASPRNGEAAYNYEFVARMRDQVAREPKGTIAKTAGSSATVMGGDLPAGPTIHGAPGAPPPEAKMEELQTIMPMEYGDREAQPEATPGVRRERKG